jgi:5-(carboxyamino)imidazole ribonucleotide synthase
MQTNFEPELQPASAQTAAPLIGPRLGIIGGGQLARMTAMSALQLGCDVVVLEKTAQSPAATLATHSLVGDWNTAAALLDLARRVDIVTLENEFVPAELLTALEEHGHTVLPGARSLGLVQDKFLQKQTLEKAGLPVPRMRAVPDIGALAAATAELGLPCLLKARRNAYDGKGNVNVRTPDDLAAAWERLGGPGGNPLFVEQFCDFTAELATIITRGRNGESVAYPVVETVQRNHVCHLVRAPAPVPVDIAARAAGVARRAVEAVGAVGSYGVEMFLTRDGDIMVNELAPRVHNSGHYTIEACLCSQFENHVRAVLGLPLGSVRMVAPAAVMVNLLGETRGPARVRGLADALAVPGAHVHLYGKTATSPGRKLGHVTALGATLAEAELAATRAAASIRFGTKS